MLNFQESLIVNPHLSLNNQMNELIDFCFVQKEWASKYCLDNGRKAIDPIQLFKYLLLKSIYNLSDRDLIERAKFDLSFKYFFGELQNMMSLTRVLLPSLESCVLMKDLLISKTDEIALENNVISNHILIIDATHTRSKYSIRKSQEVLHARAKHFEKLFPN